MHKSDNRSFSKIVLKIQASTEELALLAKSLESEGDVFGRLAYHLEKLSDILVVIKDSVDIMDTPPIHNAMESIERELSRSKTLIMKANSKRSIKEIKDMIQDLGRSLGLVLFASIDLQLDIKEKIGALHREMMNERVNEASSSHQSQSSGPSSPYQSSGELGFANYADPEKEIQEEVVIFSVDDTVWQLKYGNDEDFKFAVLGLNNFVRNKTVSNEWVDDEEIIPILLKRLASSKPNNSLAIIQILRYLASERSGNKEKMADVGCLSALVNSMTQDVYVRREAVEMLLELSDLSSVRRRIGRIHGSIVMLVSMLNGDEAVASHCAEKLLNDLSSNTQNALHMVEAGYFKPLVHHLKEGSDMSKILMATALSRMELTDQSKTSLGENGAIEPLVKLFTDGKLEAKLAALGALQNLSGLTANIHRLISAGIVGPLLQLLFSVTSVLMTLREPASAILAKVAQSESILVNQDVAQQMLSLLNLSSPVIQYHLLQALNSISSHSSASKVRKKMNENGAIQLLLPFLTETKANIRTAALNLIYTLSCYLSTELTEQLEEKYIFVIVNIITSSTSDCEKSAAIGILSNIPVSDKKVTDILKKLNLLPVLISIPCSERNHLSESVAGLLIRFTVPSDKKLQLVSVQHGVIPFLVNLLSNESVVTRCRAATSLCQLSQNSLSLRKSKKSRWLCVPPSAEAFCEVHDGYCFVKSTFCLVKAGAIAPLIRVLEGEEREADEAVLSAIATLLQDEICENGSNCIANLSGVEPIIKILESGSVKAQGKALWILERIFKIEEHRLQYQESAQVILIDLAQNGDPRLKPTTAKLLAQLELLQAQSSYF